VRKFNESTEAYLEHIRGKEPVSITEERLVELETLHKRIGEFRDKHDGICPQASLLALFHHFPDLLTEIRRLQKQLTDAKWGNTWLKGKNAVADGTIKELREQVEELEEAKKPRVILYTDSEGKQCTANEQIVELEFELSGARYWGNLWWKKEMESHDRLDNLQEAYTELEGDYNVLKEQAKELVKALRKGIDGHCELCSRHDEDETTDCPDCTAEANGKLLANLPAYLHGGE